ncbi:MAG TPA: FAD:protein FMN transferase [Micromonosporaceae bacterium]|jgi:thiamine biosynthesis lipoprotein
MPLLERLPVGDDCAQWMVWGTVARLVVTEPAARAEATAIVRGELASIDEACSRFRPDSELRRVASAAGRPVRVSPLLTELVGVALRAARDTDGDVTPTVGAALATLGYDRDFALLPGRRLVSALTIYPVPDWRRVRLEGDLLTVPAGVELDFGATAKAAAADRCAAAVADRCGVGVLVALGGDIATVGPAPGGGWRVLVRDRPDDPECLVTLPGGAALATSSTVSRRWRSADEALHHIIDPQTGRSARPVWRTVSLAAFDCVRANTLSTAAVVRGRRAVAWLRGLGAPARLVATDGSVTRLGGWPERGGD